MAFASKVGVQGNTEGAIVMTKAVRVHKVGGPEALVYEDVVVAAPGPGEVRIRQHAVGVNFIDVSFRTGLSKAFSSLRERKRLARSLRSAQASPIFTSAIASPTISISAAMRPNG
jgi:hypothetical protein